MWNSIKGVTTQAYTPTFSPLDRCMNGCSNITVFNFKVLVHVCTYLCVPKCTNYITCFQR